MQKIRIAIVILASLLVLVSITLFWININEKQANSIYLKRYTYTAAICNETNFCQDYLIECQGNKTLNINPLTGAFIQHSPDWQDPRDETIRKTLCEETII